MVFVIIFQQMAVKYLGEGVSHAHKIARAVQEGVSLRL